MATGRLYVGLLGVYLLLAGKLTYNNHQILNDTPLGLSN